MVNGPQQKAGSGPIAVFDSGYGGLTILKGIRHLLPQYNFIYLGDNARAPYGTRSFDVVYEFTLQAVKKLFSLGSPLVILGCNTASAKALRSIQQKYIAECCPDKRVLGVIRPTAEVVGDISQNGHIGVLATEGTVKSNSYNIEIKKLSPDAVVTGQACPMWVPLVENNEYSRPGADFFVKDSIDKILDKDPLIDTLILACTHFPLLIEKIRKYVPQNIRIISQGEYIAKSLENYLFRHPEMECRIERGGTTQFFTTESASVFEQSARNFLQTDIKAERISI